ncbi:hypothetical protein CRE_14095 [Caenorhabditis remanei]|uniref:F-box associated domain-containing protein n=1 Tax=Caenorhabditis remanei TaxID=31234 RepID=E3MRH2_CAERE|nr:hypothetical protein CRE_14095 [Caenorhabditis remanei]
MNIRINDTYNQSVFRCTKKPPTQIWTHVLEYLEKEDDNALEFLQTHLESLFVNQPPSQLKIESTNSLQSSEIIDNVTDTIFSLDELETTEIKHFLTVRPNQKSVEIHSDLTGRPLKRVSKLFKVPGLAIHESGSMTSKYMDNFSGRCLLLFNANVTYSAWTTLIEKWKNKTAYHKLHAVVTRVPRNVFQEFHFGELLFESNALPWDGISRPRNFMFDPRIPSYRSKSIDCSDWFDIQQNGGGKWASIQIINDKIMFFVWD